jgi:hypothetical protein
MVAELFTHNYGARQPNVRRSFVNVYDDVDAYRSLPIPDPDTLSSVPLLNYQIKFLSDSAEPIKTRRVHLNLVPFFLEIFGDVRNQFGLRLRLLRFTARPGFPPLTLTLSSAKWKRLSVR